MNSEPALDRAAIAAILARAYGFVAAEVQFIPTAWTAYAYQVLDQDGRRWFLKIRDAIHPPVYAASCPEFYLPLTHQLHARGILPYIPHPRMSVCGDFEVCHEPYRLILYNYIGGKTVGQKGMTEVIRTELAHLLGILHGRSLEVDVTPRFCDRYDIVFESELMHVLDDMGTFSQGLTEGRQALRALLHDHGRLLMLYLERLHALQSYTRALDKMQVICHTDLHGDNLMIDTDGNLVILDWENALLAPPEHDLFFFVGEGYFWDRFLPIYQREAGDVLLDSRVFAFYFYRRGLEDLADWVARIESGAGDADQDCADLADIRDGLLGMQNIEKTVADIALRLGAGM